MVKLKYRFSKFHEYFIVSCSRFTEKSNQIVTIVSVIFKKMPGTDFRSYFKIVLHLMCI